MHWHDVYARGVQCGQGLELTFAGGMMVKPFMGHEFCTMFYERIQGNYCTQSGFGTMDTTSWCYVSSDCHQLGRIATSSVNTFLGFRNMSVKTCQNGVDTTLQSMTPEDLHELSVQEDMDAGLMIQMAYPVFPKAQLNWPEVKAHINGETTEKSETIAAKLAEQQASGQPLMFSSVSGHPPFGLVYGTRIYEADFTPWFHEQQEAQRDPFAHPGLMNNYTCIAGC
jgi:hypothetical protein